MIADDLLYRKFEHMRREFDRDVEAKMRKHRTFEILRLTDQNVYEALMIHDVQVGPDHTRIVVR